MTSDSPELSPAADTAASMPATPAVRMIVVCRSEKTAARWHVRQSGLKGIEVVTELGCRSYYRLISRLLAEGQRQPVLLCHDDICCGLGFAAAVHDLIAELSRSHACWGLCGNAGISWDGRQVYRYIKDPHGDPQHGLVPEPVLGIDGNMMLLNVPALAAAGVEVPDLGGFHGYDIVLSLETLRRGLPVLCDRRLFVMHKSGGDNKAFQAFVVSERFQNYLVQRFLNHSLPTMNGPVDTRSAHDYRYLEIPGSGTGQQDVVELFDKALAAARRLFRPSLTIVCRTQFNRPEMLTRAVASFAVAAHQAPELLDIKVRIISDRPEELMSAELAHLGRLFPGLDLAGWSVTCQPDRFSRTDLLLQAIEKAETDSLWFVDDDDYVIPSSIRPLARALAKTTPRLVVGNAQRVEELWETSAAGSRRIKSNRQVGRNSADGIFHAFDGDNHSPICSVVFPLQVLKQRTAGVAARGDYFEDYFLILLTLSASRIEVRLVQEDLCGISLRTGENTVTEPVRDHWDLSYATFMMEILRHPEATSPLLWQLTERSKGLIAGLHGRIADLDGRRAQLQQLLADRDNTIAAMRNTLGWRLAAPLRWCGDLLGKTPRFFGPLPLLVHKGGGTARSATKGFTILKREGLHGIGYRIARVRLGLKLSSDTLVARHEYAGWVRRHDTLTDRQRSRMREEIGRFRETPLISVIMPISEPRPKCLIEAIESVRRQIYPHGEMCIAADAAVTPEIRDILEASVSADPRLKVEFLPVTGRIPEAANSALERAGGEWTMLLGQEDVLAECALFHVANVINDHAGAALIFSDEDKVDENGERFSPYLKGDWNREQFSSHDMITHLAVYRTDYVRNLGGFRKGATGAHDYDLAMRYVERIELEQIIHIPRILYHSRDRSKTPNPPATA